MASVRIFIALAFIALASATPAPKNGFDSDMEEMRSMCSNDDPLACIKYKAMSFLDSLFKKDIYQVSEDVEITRNGRSNEITGRSSGLEESLENYIQTHDVTFKLPVVGSTVTLGARNLDQDELDLNMKFSSGVEARGKSRLKKIFVPILVFVLLKAITLIPLAIGVLGLKAWNALQLSFFSFIVSVSLAVFQLCKKIAADNAHPQISAHSPWEAGYQSHYARALDDAQDLAYSAYKQ